MNTFNKIGISLALVFMIIELSYINAKSLFYLSGSVNQWDNLFAISGSIAFSMVTVLVMRNSVIKWIKYVFPIFDAGLIFLGFNLMHAEAILNGTDNPVRFALTIFMALFTGLITFSLGLIEFKAETTKEERQIGEYKQKWYAANKELESLKSNAKSVQSDTNSHKTEISSLESKLASLHSELKLKQSDIDKMKPIYLTAEVSRVKKKKPENRTPYESKLLLEVEMAGSN